MIYPIAMAWLAMTASAQDKTIGERTILKMYGVIGLKPLIATVLMIPQFAKYAHSGNRILEKTCLSFQLKYQLLLPGSLLLSLAVIFPPSRNQFLSFFRIGDISVPAASVKTY